MTNYNEKSKMNEQTFAELLSGYPAIINDRNRLLGSLKDLFPGETAQINLLMNSFDIGIVKEIQNNDLDILLFNRMKTRIVNDYGVEGARAEWSVSMWFRTYGQAVLGKCCEYFPENSCKEQQKKEESRTSNIALTSTQQKAVDSSQRRIAVIAGPGSGKTRVLTERIVSLIQEKGVSEERILALSFSSKAAKEMRERLHERLGNKIYKIEVKTFHSFGLQIIRQNYDLLGLSEEFEVLSNAGKNKYLRQILKSNRIPEKEMSDCSQRISKIKNGDNSLSQRYQSIAKQYNEAIHNANCIDFDDMVALAVTLLKKHADIREAYRKRYLHILVDEVQDLNENQTEMVDLLLDNQSSLFIVGDDDQCIYEWRGAKPNYLKDMSQDSRIEVIKLEDNFRSEKSIVDISSSLISNNENRIKKIIQPKKLWKKKASAATPSASSTQALRFRGAAAEATYIANEIKKLADDGYKYGDIAILVRSAKQVPDISDELSRLGIPCYEQITESSYDEIIPVLRAVTHIKSKNTINRAINYPIPVMDNFLFTDLQERFDMDKSLSVFDSFSELNSNGQQFDDCDVFRSRFAVLTRLNKTYMTISSHEVLSELYTQYSTEPFANSKKAKEKLEHLKTLIEIAKDFDSAFDSDNEGKPQLEEFIDYLTLSSQDDSPDSNGSEGVNLMTCHKSKGLEFPIVFIPGVQVGTFPNDYFISSKDDVEAERRLFYVSMTRAIDKLYLTCSEDPFEGKGLVKKGFMAEIPGVKIRRNKEE